MGALAASFRGTVGPGEISGRDGRETIRGLGGNDRHFGRGGDDESYGNNGDARLMVDDGNRDTVCCGSGTDYVYADDVRETVYYGRGTVKR